MRFTLPTISLMLRFLLAVLPAPSSSSNPPVSAEAALRSAGDNFKVREAQLETLVVAEIMLSILKVAFSVSAAVILTWCVISLLIK